MAGAADGPRGGGPPGGGGQPAASMLGIELTLVPDARPAFSGGLIDGDAPPRTAPSPPG